MGRIWECISHWNYRGENKNSCGEGDKIKWGLAGYVKFCVRISLKVRCFGMFEWTFIGDKIYSVWRTCSSVHFQGDILSRIFIRLSLYSLCRKCRSMFFPSCVSGRVYIIGPVRASVSALSIEPFDVQTQNLVQGLTLTISWTGWKVKVIGQRSRSLGW